MPQFEVQLRETVFYTMQVEAPSSAEARELAEADWAQSEDPFGDFNGNGHGVTAYSVDPVAGEDEPELRTFDVRIGADVRCYVHCEQIEAVDEEAARAAVLEEINSAGPVLAHWSWKPEEVQGGISILVEDADDDSEGQFVAVPDWNGPDYGTLEAFVRRMAALTTPEEEFKALEESAEGTEYDDVDEFVADLDDDRLCDEYSAFMDLIREAKQMMEKK